MRTDSTSPLAGGETIALYLGDRLVGYKTAHALLVDTELTEAEKRFVRVKADLLDIAVSVFGGVLNVEDNTFLNQLTRAITIPNSQFDLTDDDQLIADRFFVPVEQVTVARTEYAERSIGRRAT